MYKIITFLESWKSERVFQVYVYKNHVFFLFLRLADDTRKFIN